MTRLEGPASFLGLSLPSTYQGRFSVPGPFPGSVSMNILQASQETEEMGLGKEASVCRGNPGLATHINVGGVARMLDTGGLPHE